MKRRGIVFICVVCLIFTAFLQIAGCSGKEQDNHADEQETMNVDVGENGTIRNGTEYRTYQVEEGQKGIIAIRISAQSGGLDMDVYPADSKDTPEYTGRDLDSTSFEVILSKPGEYELCVTAKEYVGDYEINFRTEDNTEK